MSNISLGIDVSKLELSVALLKDNKSIKLKFSNDIVGFKKLYKWLCANKATDIKMCMEATGHYSLGIADFLYQKKCDVYIINPFCIKSFANGKLSRNKTDEADAVIIAQYIKQTQAAPYKPAPKIIREIRELDKTLEAMKINRAQVKTRLADGSYLPQKIISIWKTTLEHLDLQIKNIETSLHDLISAKSELKQDYENLQTIPGISSTTAITILALVPDISEFINARQLAAFAGLTPKQRTSGRSIRGKTKLSKMGSIRLRKALFFPAISAKQYNPVVKKFCDNLRNKSKCKMVVIGAAMRKLMHIIFAIFKHKVVFNTNLNSITSL